MGVFAREQWFLLTLKKLCFAHSLLIGKIWQKKSWIISMEEKKPLSSKPRGLDLNVFLFLFVLNIFMHFYAVLFIYLFFCLTCHSTVWCLLQLSPSSPQTLVSPLIMNSHKLLYFKKDKVSLPSLDSKNIFKSLNLDDVDWGHRLFNVQDYKVLWITLSV